MARIRYLKPDFFKDEDLKDLPYEARLLYAGLWCWADKEGRLEDRPKRLKIEIFPYDKVDIEKFLTILASPKNGNNRPYIQRYEVDNEKYIQILNWHKHQRPHHTEKESIIPPAPPYKDKENGDGKPAQSKLEKSNGELTVKRPLKPLSDLDFINNLKTNPAYKHINFDIELAKMDAWLLVHKGRQKTRRFIVNWLNKVDKPVDIVDKSKLTPKPIPQVNPEEKAKVSKLIHETIRKISGNKK